MWAVVRESGVREREEPVSQSGRQEQEREHRGARVQILFHSPLARVSLVLIVLADAVVLARILGEARMAPAAAQKQRVVIDLRAVERVCGIVDADGVAEALGHDWVRVEIGSAAHVACHRETGRGRRSVSDDALLGCGYVCVCLRACYAPWIIWWAKEEV